MLSSREVDELNHAIHVLLLRLNIARLDLWSDELVGIGHLELHAMQYVENNPSHTLGQVREELQVPQSTLTGIIDRLEKRGLVRRSIHPTDKRSYLIELTSKGQEVQREHHRVEKMIMRKILGALPTPADRTKFVALFRTIASAIASKP